MFHGAVMSESDGRACIVHIHKHAPFPAPRLDKSQEEGVPSAASFYRLHGQFGDLARFARVFTKLSHASSTLQIGIRTRPGFLSMLISIMSLIIFVMFPFKKSNPEKSFLFLMLYVLMALFFFFCNTKLLVSNLFHDIRQEESTFPSLTQQ